MVMMFHHFLYFPYLVTFHVLLVVLFDFPRPTRINAYSYSPELLHVFAKKLVGRTRHKKKKKKRKSLVSKT